MLKTHPTSGDTCWFVRDRFGLFIHWGLYSLAARHEWVKSREKIPDDLYDARYFKHFDPDLYDPHLWAKAAGDAGMKYFVVTVKHHEGFCLWDSKLTDYKATHTPARRDLIRPLVEAMRARGLRTGFYYSLIDWHHPHYIIDNRNHPRRDEIPIQGEIDAMIAQAGGDAGPRAARVAVDPNLGRDQQKYIDYLHGQVRELLSEYGQIDILWFDFSFVNKQDRTNFVLGKGREAWGSEKLLEMIRRLQPKILLTDRLDLDMFLSGGDFKTPEQAQPVGWVHVDGKPVVWEACQTFSGSWGYHRDECTWRSTRQLIQTLIDCVSKGGNLLLNVGPTARGEFDERALDRLNGIGQWMRRHSRSIYDCTQAPAEFQCPPDCRFTYNPQTNRLYVHLFAWPYKHLHLVGDWTDRVEYAQLLHDASEIRQGLDSWHAAQLGLTGKALSLSLPLVEPNVAVPVIELFLK